MVLAVGIEELNGEGKGRSEGWEELGRREWRASIREGDVSRRMGDLREIGTLGFLWI